MNFINNNITYLDFASRWQISFQDAGTSIMQGIVNLHHHIFFLLIVIITFVFYIFFKTYKLSVWNFKPTSNLPEQSLIKNFFSGGYVVRVIGLESFMRRGRNIQQNGLDEYYKKDRRLFFSKLDIFYKLNIIHGTVLEIIWTIVPSLILLLIVGPSFSLLYAMDAASDPDFTIKVIGHQWYWTYEYSDTYIMFFDAHDFQEAHGFFWTWPSAKGFSNEYCEGFASSWNGIHRIHKIFEGFTPMYRMNFWHIWSIFDKSLFNLCEENKILTRFPYYCQENYVKVKPVAKGFNNFPSMFLGSMFKLDYSNPFDGKMAPISLRTFSIYTDHAFKTAANEDYDPDKAKIINPKYKRIEAFYALDSYMKATSDLKEGELRLLEVDNSLYLPTYSKVRLDITSDDVLHAFAVPSLGIKIDAVPGRLNVVYVDILRAGVYFGQCSELCGVNHGYMPIKVIAVNYEDFIKIIMINSSEILSPMVNVESDIRNIFILITRCPQDLYMTFLKEKHGYMSTSLKPIIPLMKKYGRAVTLKSDLMTYYFTLWSGSTWFERDGFISNVWIKELYDLIAYKWTQGPFAVFRKDEMLYWYALLNTGIIHCQDPFLNENNNEKLEWLYRYFIVKFDPVFVLDNNVFFRFGNEFESKNRNWTLMKLTYLRNGYCDRLWKTQSEYYASYNMKFPDNLNTAEYQHVENVLNNFVYRGIEINDEYDSYNKRR